MWSELFLLPFLTGLGLAVLLPLLGCYLRLRNEWLAALAYSHVAAAGALLAQFAGLAPPLGGLGLAGLAAVAKRFAARRLEGATGYVLLLLGGWSAGVLIAANHPLAERLGHALFDGQLYFAGSEQLLWVGLALLPGLLLLKLFSRQLLLARLYPDFTSVRGLKSWPTQLGFNLLTATLLALATTSMGVMGAFALVFVPPWLAFRRARSWRGGLLMALLIGLLAYSGAFAVALVLDQPFGPVLTFLLIFTGLIIA